jgi:hypothetical protein
MAHTQTSAKHTSANTNKLERIGFWLSLACAIHCLAMPLIITILPFVGNTFLADHQAEFWVLGSSWILAGVLLYKDFRKHKNHIPLLLLAGSIAVKMVEVWILGESYEQILAPIGGVIIAIAYYFNWKYNAQCTCGHEH